MEEKRSPLQFVRTWRGDVLLGLLVLAAVACWSLAMPPMSSPDEPSHVIRAAAQVRGDSGRLSTAPVDANQPGSPTLVTLPSDYGVVMTLPNCIAFHPEQPASCQPPVPGPDGTVEVPTFAGQYPPLYYLLVGWPSLLLPALPAVYGMRLVSAALTAALVAWGIAGLRRAAAPVWAWTWAVAAALTPMCLFLGGTVNPQGLEIAAAFTTWSAGMVLSTGDGPPRRADVARFVVAAAVFASVRATGPVIGTGVAVVLVVLAGRGRLRELWRSTSVRVGLAVVLTAAAATAVWVATHGSVVSTRGLRPDLASPRVAVFAVAARTFTWGQQMIGDFGWLDTPSPGLTIVVWVVATGALLLVALALPRRPDRRAIALGLAAGGTLALPFVLQVPTAADAGIIWQGRYALPLAVGVPLVAAAGLRGVPAAAYPVGRRAVTWLLAMVVAGHVAAFWWAAHRYAEGSDGRLVTLHPEWFSALGYLTAVAGYAVLVTAIALLAWYRMRTSDTVSPPDGGAAPPRGTPRDVPAPPIPR